MTNLMTKLKNGIAIGALLIGTIAGTQNAQAALIGTAATIGGFELSKPWDPAVKDMTYADQKNALVTDGWTMLTLVDVDYFISAFGLAADDYTGFVTKLGFDTSLSVENGVPACDKVYCDIRLNTEGSVDGTHLILLDDQIQYTLDKIFDIDTTSAGFPIGAIGYKIVAQPAPSPEVTGLMLGGLGLMGFAALRRK